MQNIFNVYCDESCHLEKDRQPVMLQGALWCPFVEARQLSIEIRKIKKANRADGELKWTKVSQSRIDFYLELVDFFFKNPTIHFRALVVLEKGKLNHARYNLGSHDDFYYKMYFSLLSKILSPDKQYNIYLDIKDTRSREKVKKLGEVLCNNVYDFTSQMIKHIQNVHSYESDLMQICDFLLGAVSYKHRGLASNPAKKRVVEEIEKQLGRTLLESTSLGEEKFNLFLFTPLGD